MISQKDKEIVRELAKRYLEIAAGDRQDKMNRRMRDTNDLKLVRPPVLLDEIPWYQMDIDGELTCLCEDKGARNVETFSAARCIGKSTFVPTPFLNPSFGFEWRTIPRVSV